MIVILKVVRKKELPSLGLSLLPIVLPIVLIFIKAVVHLFVKDVPEALTSIPYQIVSFLGHPVIVLALSVLISVYTLLPKADKKYDCTSS